MAEPDSNTPVIPPQRLIALADGVFAIVMTLLVFELAVPLANDDQDLASELAEMWPEFLIYVLSFLALGVFWLMHHLIFDRVERYDTTLIWLNISFLMFASLIPFSTRLFIEHGASTVTALVYGANLVLLFAMALATFAYAAGDNRLTADDLDSAVVRGARRMGFAYLAIVVVAMVISLVSPVAAFILYGVFVLTIIIFTMLGRAEVVVILPGASSTPSTKDASSDDAPT